ncbi:MAG: LamG domain-containing protein [Candidatus Bathyarchaeota archaeon]|nr:LamG domain-containing protein [Candidatus Bathyarchaeum sp.]
MHGFKLTKTVNSMLISVIVFSLFLASAQLPLVHCVQSSTVGLWHMDEILASGYSTITPDSTGYNNGTVGGDIAIVEGKFDKAFQFKTSGYVYVPIRFLVGFPPTPEPIYVPVCTTLDVQEELKIEAWINVQSFTNATYNNIVVKCTRNGSLIEDVTRVFGLAVKPSPDNENLGVLSGCINTDASGFNEILTVEPVISLNTWINVAFTRTSTGMHLYVNGEEQAVTVIEGVRNPVGSILNGTEAYLGHDSEMTIDEIRISDLAPEVVASQIDIGDNLLIAIIVVVVVFSTAWVLRKAIQMWVIYSKSKN